MFPDWLIHSLIFFGFVGVVLAPICLALFPDLNRFKTLREHFEHLAMKGLGRLDIKGDGPIPYPLLTLDWGRPGGTTAWLAPDLVNDEQNAGALALMMAAPPGWGRLEVRPRDAVAVAKHKGMTPVAFNVLAVDKVLMASTDDQAWFETLCAPLAEGLRQVLAALEKPGLALSVSPRRLELRMLGATASAAQLELTVLAIRQIVDALASHTNPGAAPRPWPLCQVCGQDLEQPELFCRRCRAPYHRDCWTHAGLCTLYPCAGPHPVSVPTGHVSWADLDSAEAPMLVPTTPDSPSPAATAPAGDDSRIAP